VSDSVNNVEVFTGMQVVQVKPILRLNRGRLGGLRRGAQRGRTSGMKAGGHGGWAQSYGDGSNRGERRDLGFHLHSLSNSQGSWFLVNPHTRMRFAFLDSHI